jgi:hypothetical protein
MKNKWDSGGNEGVMFCVVLICIIAHASMPIVKLQFTQLKMCTDCI